MRAMRNKEESISVFLFLLYFFARYEYGVLVEYDGWL